MLRGTWFDRGAEYKARQRGETVLARQFATSYDVKLTQLPCLQHLTRSQHQAEIRRMVKDIEEQAKAVNLAKGRTPMGVAAILKQDPHSRPATTDRSPAPLSMRRQEDGDGVSREVSRVRRRVPSCAERLKNVRPHSWRCSLVVFPAGVALQRPGLSGDGLPVRSGQAT